MAWFHARRLGLCFIVMLLIGVQAGIVGEARAASDEGVIFASERMRLTAYFDVGKVEIVLSDGRHAILPQAISASGARYTDGSTVFWNKGDWAYFELDGSKHELRVVDPSVDPWERARQAGVDFRAMGQEPGWLLEIRDDWYVKLELDYGETQITTRIGSPVVDTEAGTTTYKTEHPYSPLDITVTIRHEMCHDTMSGEGFTASVLVELGGTDRIYSGCGRAL